MQLQRIDTDGHSTIIPLGICGNSLVGKSATIRFLNGQKSSYGFDHRHNLKNPRVDQPFPYECQNWGVYRKSFLKAEGAPIAVGGIVLDNASKRVQQINRKTTGQKNEVYMYI